VNIDYLCVIPCERTEGNEGTNEIRIPTSSQAWLSASYIKHPYIMFDDFLILCTVYIICVVNLRELNLHFLSNHHYKMFYIPSSIYRTDAMLVFVSLLTEY
jgi:hypothetical protein